MHYLICYYSNLYHVYNNNYNNNYSFVIFICLQAFLQATLVRYSFYTTIRCSAHNIFVSANLYQSNLHSSDLQTRNFFNKKLAELLLTERSLEKSTTTVYVLSQHVFSSCLLLQSPWFSKQSVGLLVAKADVKLWVPPLPYEINAHNMTEGLKWPIMYVCMLLLLIQMFDVFVYTLTLVDIVGGLPVTISRHLFALEYLCKKLVQLLLQLLFIPFM